MRGPMLGRGAKAILITIGIVTCLGTIGIDVTTLVAGLGLSGFAAGFALKDIISNALSGVLLILSRPFKQGDRISVFANKDLSGVVLDINLRYTVLDTGKDCIYVPNSILFINAVTVIAQHEEPVKFSSVGVQEGSAASTDSSYQDGDGGHDIRR